MEENPLHKAHALSAKASLLLKPSTASLETLVQARDTYKQATELFESALETQKGADEKKTLSLLVNQHRKLAKDVGRRISAWQRAIAAQNIAQPMELQASPQLEKDGMGGSNDGQRPGYRPGARRATTDGAGFSARRESVGLASATNLWPAGISTRMGVPPFSLRPANFSRQPSQPSQPTATTTPPTASPTRPSAQTPGDQFSLSPLNSSSSSDESFLNLGAIPDTLDPFSRFWGMLENMLDDISNPVAFASAPLGIPADVPTPSSRGNIPETNKKDMRSRKEERGDIQDHLRDPSPAESFYVVHRSRPSGSSRRASPVADSPSLTARSDNASGKTPEELALENLNLRASLDEIASHAEKLERANKALQEQGEERDRAMRNIALGVRREAHRVKQGQDLIRSQLMASMSHSSSSQLTGRKPPFIEMSMDGETALKARIKELEDEVKRLQADNEKQKTAAVKYKDQLNQIKTNARAKRDAKLANAEGLSRTTLPRRAPSDE